MVCLSSFAGRAAVAVVSCVTLAAACGGDTVEHFDDDGAGGTVVTTTQGGSGGSPVVTTVTGGSGGTMAQGGSGGDPFEWSEPPLHLEEHCFGEAEIGVLTTFTVPPNTFGFTVVGRAATSNTVVGVERLRPGGNGSVINEFDISGKDFDAFVDLGIISAANPQSDLPQAWPMFIGDWRVRFGDDGTGSPVDACVYMRRSADGLRHGGVMDVNVRIAPGAGVDNNYVQAVLNEMHASFFNPAIGVTGGNVTNGTLPAGYNTVSSSAELAELFESSAGFGPRPAVNLFVVGDFSGGELGGAIGIAGGIPGAPVIHGTPQSGVAYQPSGDTDYDASVLAHEIGHLGGLFHTTESSIDETDPLSDTPECGNINGDPNGCPDVDNMMFPIAYGGMQITADQAMVLAGSVLYRGKTTEGGSAGASLPGQAAALIQQPHVDVVQTLPTTTRRAPQDDIERLLSSVWCAHSGTDYYAWIRDLTTISRLLEIARDEAVFDIARGRALDALARFAVLDAEVAELAVIAEDVLRSPNSGRVATLAAITILARDHDATLVVVAPALRARGDEIVKSRLAALGL